MKSIITAFLVLNFAMHSFAQDNQAVDELVKDSKQDLLVVVGGGLAGAVLGLSTLSFVDEPKDHTKNILTGAAIGIIVGVGYVAFNQANKSKDMIYDPGQETSSNSGFGTSRRSAWHRESHYNGDRLARIQSPWQVDYKIRF